MPLCVQYTTGSSGGLYAGVGDIGALWTHMFIYV